MKLSDTPEMKKLNNYIELILAILLANTVLLTSVLIILIEMAK